MAQSINCFLHIHEQLHPDLQHPQQQLAGHGGPCVCSPNAGGTQGWRQEDPRGWLAGSLAKLIQTRFSERSFLKNQSPELLRGTLDVNLWPPHRCACTHVYMHLQTPRHCRVCTCAHTHTHTQFFYQSAIAAAKGKGVFVRNLHLSHKEEIKEFSRPNLASLKMPFESLNFVCLVV